MKTAKEIAESILAESADKPADSVDALHAHVVHLAKEGRGYARTVGPHSTADHDIEDAKLHGHHTWVDTNDSHNHINHSLKKAGWKPENPDRVTTTYHHPDYKHKIKKVEYDPSDPMDTKYKVQGPQVREKPRSDELRGFFVTRRDKPW